LAELRKGRFAYIEGTVILFLEGKILKNPGVAAVLSFFIAGLGQIYNGQIGKGIGFIIAYFISALLMFVLIGFITTPILWIWGMVDAYKTAERINREQARGPGSQTRGTTD
jgi:TM2 domain-containing membrane protein YozV